MPACGWCVTRAPQQVRRPASSATHRQPPAPRRARGRHGPQRSLCAWHTYARYSSGWQPVGTSSLQRLAGLVSGRGARSPRASLPHRRQPLVARASHGWLRQVPNHCRCRRAYDITNGFVGMRGHLCSGTCVHTRSHRTRCPSTHLRAWHSPAAVHRAPTRLMGRTDHHNLTTGNELVAQ